ncbi:MAG: glycine--tRNA ligase subunit beta [Sphingomonas sp.]
MTDFLLELLSEEIPARMQTRAREDLARLFAAELAKAGVKAGEIATYATPRRLALIARDLPLETAATAEEIKGPRVGAPPQALEGFLRKTGLAAEQLVERDGVFFATIEQAGRQTADVLAEVIPAIIRAFPWPKSMRWGAASVSTESLRWVRPLQGIVALLGDVVVPCEVAGIASGRETVGHRFHSSGAVSVPNAAGYVEALRAAHVIVDQKERALAIALGAKIAARDAGLTLIEDEGLLEENTGLTEWPVPLLGRFDAAFLSVPPEVIQLTARVNQKYFVCADADGKLANAFICTANIDAADGGAKIIEGNRKVLAARLADARFFYETDLKVPLDEQAKKLDRIVFHEKLGTVADKVARVAKLAAWLAGEGIVPGCDPALARRAAALCKADLVTGMVGEFPELQGVMGGYYAAAQGEAPAVAAAVRDHYKPVGAGDEVPTDPVTVAVSLADKLDTLANFFIEGMPPTGSKDPFALRRAALAVVSTVLQNGLRFRLERALLAACDDDLEKFEKIFFGRAEQNLAAFFADRLKVQQREAGVRHDLIDAVFAAKYQNDVGEDDLVRLLARVHALQAFITTPDGVNLLAGYKRAANILKKEAAEGLAWRAPAYTPEPAEAALIVAVAAAEPLAADAVAREDFEGAMAALASLRAPIDAFFDGVIVNDSDPTKRAMRLALLEKVRHAVHSVADFSKIEG